MPTKIKINNNMSKIQREFVSFMNKHDITNLLAAKLLDCGRDTICRYRMGYSKLTKDVMTNFKRRYKEYLQKQLDSIKT